MHSTNQPRRSYSDTTAWLVAYGIAIGFCVVSLIANICFAASVAASPVEKAILIATAVLLDLVKATALVLAFRSYMRGHLFFAGVTVVFGLGALAWSSISGLGFIATARSNAAAIHASVQEQQSAWITTVLRADARLAAVSSARPAAVIEADIAAHGVPPHIWVRTRECADPSLAKLHGACAPILKLRRELAKAHAAEGLEAQIGETRKQLATLPIVAASDPQVAALSRILGATEPALRDVLAIVLAALVEAGSTLGFAIARGATQPTAPSAVGASTNINSGHRRSPRKPASGRGGQCDPTRRSPAPPNTHRTTIERWMAVSVVADAAGEIAARSAFAAFCGWVLQHGFESCSETTFGTTFTRAVTERGGRKDIRRSGRYYAGVRLAVTAAPVTAMRAAA
jgi:hypothetical protein